MNRYPDEFLAYDEMATGADESAAPELWQGLVGAWPTIANTGLTLRDASGFGNHGTISGPTWNVGAIGRTLTYGTSKSTTIPQSARYSGVALTFHAWLYNDAWADNHCWLMNGTYSSSWAFAFQKNFLFIPFVLNDTGNQAGTVPAGTFTNSKWQAVAVVFDGSQGTSATRLRLFVDSREVALGYAGTIPSSILAPAGSLNIGLFNGLARYFPGSIGPVTIHNRALTAGEIAALYVDPHALVRLRRRVWPVAVAAATGARRRRLLCGAYQ